jgi:ATP:corrinoid adenosyltransferase
MKKVDPLSQYPKTSLSKSLVMKAYLEGLVFSSPLNSRAGYDIVILDGINVALYFKLILISL